MSASDSDSKRRGKLTFVPACSGEYWGTVIFPPVRVKLLQSVARGFSPLLLLQQDYPFAPPGIKVSFSEHRHTPPGLTAGRQMNTPSGRFAPSAAICTSMSNFHPGPSFFPFPLIASLDSFLTALSTGSWNPAWSVNTILVGLLSFMLGDEITTGAALCIFPSEGIVS
jgi:ubiquitin-conjugating enzyme E2 J2